MSLLHLARRLLEQRDGGRQLSAGECTQAAVALVDAHEGDTDPDRCRRCGAELPEYEFGRPRTYCLDCSPRKSP